MSEPEQSPLLKIHTTEQFDGSLWRQYEFDDSIFILTGQGRALAAAGSIANILRNYTLEADNGLASGNSRIHLATGGNANVFSVGDQPLVVKESLPDRDQLIPALYRMDRLVNAIESHCPHWLGMPKHYGIYFPKNDPSKQFLLMQKIDEGITVGDVLNYWNPRPDRAHLTDMVTKVFGEVTPKIQREVSDRFVDIKGELRKALLAEYLSPDEYLPDIDNNPYNLVIDKLDVPVGGSHIKYWIIDQ